MSDVDFPHRHSSERARPIAVVPAEFHDATQAHFNIDAERLLVGALLFDNARLSQVAPLVEPKDFRDEVLGQAYGAIRDLTSNGLTAGPLTVANALGGATTPGGQPMHLYLMQLVKNCADRVSTLDCAQVIRDLSYKRSIIYVASDIVREIQAGADPLAVVADATKWFGDIGLRDEVDHLEFEADVTFDPAADYVVKGLFSRGHTGALYGAPGSGKSFLAIDLAYAIARGEDWHGRKVRKGAVLYVALEGTRGIQNRMLACAKDGRSAGSNFARHKPHSILNKTEEGDRGVRSIVAQARILEATSGEQIALIVIDTLARAMAGDDENSAAEMGLFVDRRIGEISRQTGAAILVVHHCGKDEGRGMRGSSAATGAFDFVIKVETTKNGIRKVESEKVKDGECGSILAFKLNQIDIGIDADGDPVSSCVVEEVEPVRAGEISLSKRCSLALGELARLHNENKGNSIPQAKLEKLHLSGVTSRDGFNPVALAAWREALMIAVFADIADAGSKRQAFKRAVDALEKAGKIGRSDGYVWLISQTSCCG